MVPARKRKKMESTAKNKRQRSAPDLETYSKDICSAVQQTRQALQPSLREKVRKVRQDMENSTQTGKDPLSLFPQEIWVMIFQQVEDVNDLANCSRACSLFEAIINSSQEELLFGKVIPFVLPYLKMDINDRNFVDKSLLLCRQVCRMWRSGVDSFANSFFRARQPNVGLVERLEKEQQIYLDATIDMSTRTFYLPLENLIDQDDSDSDEEEKDHGLKKVMESPFLCNVFLRVSSLSDLDTCGHRIGRLNFRQKEDDQMSSQQLYALSVAVIKKCKNLQTFCLFSVPNLSQNSVDNQLEVQVHNRLECLEVLEGGKTVLPVQDKLVIGLSPKLKRIKLNLWNSQLYSTLSWNNLTAMEILEGASEEVLNSLGNMVAPNLQKLSLKLISECSDLKILFKAINQFPNLRNLCLLMSTGFDNLKEKDILNIPVDLLTVNGITILELISTQLNTSRILPVLFPAVRHLRIRYGNLAFDRRFNDLIPTKSQLSQLEFIQVYKNMYKSNIWTILPQLDCLNLECENFEKKRHGSFQRVKIINDKKKFTRQGYVLETEEYFMGYQRYLDKVWGILRDELKEKLELERKKIDKKKKVKANTRNQSTSKNGISTMFSFVLPWLGKSDALNCRLLSKSFLEIVDNHYLQTIIPDTVDKFHVPLDTNFFENNKSKPFFAYNTEIILKSCQTAGIKLVLNEIGKNVRYLTISVKPGVDPGIANVYVIVRECMKQCINMKSFSLNINFISLDGFDEYWRMKKSQKLKKPISLEEFSTYGPKPNVLPLIRAETNSALKILINDLHLMCGKTIKIRKQEYPSVVEYPELQDLTIRKLGKMEILCGAPNLQKLHLCLTMKELNFKYLWNITSKYPKLELLELQFPVECFGSTRNIIYENPHHIIKVTTLKIVVQDKLQINLDFLAHFPCVKMLQIIYGKQAPLMNAENKNEYVVIGPDILDLENSIPNQGFHPRQPEQDFIQLAKYFKDEDSLEHDKENIYASNIWVVLRRLQKLEIVFLPDKETKITDVFYRRHN